MSIAGGSIGTLALAAARPLPLTIAGSLLVGLSAGFRSHLRSPQPFAHGRTHPAPPSAS